MYFVKASNSKAENPCEIAGALEADCQGFCAFKSQFYSTSAPTSVAHSLSTAVFFLGPISQGTNYLTPQRNSSAQKCECNTVMYRYLANPCAYPPTANVEWHSLYMACTACQNVTTQTWSYWQQYCSAVYIGYPQTIPTNTAVPNWAYLDYTVRAPYRWLDMKFLVSHFPA